MFAYNYVDIPLLIPLDGVNEHPSVLESSKNFETYVNDIASECYRYLKVPLLKSYAKITLAKFHPPTLIVQNP